MNFLGGSLRGISVPNRPLVNIFTNYRQFSSSIPSLARNTKDKFYKITRYVKKIQKVPELKLGEPLPKGIRMPREIPKVPTYHFEPRFFKRQNRGLYGGVQLKKAHRCSEYFNKTKYYQKPNIQRAKLWSEALNKAISTRVSTKVLKTIDQEGGLDAYLLKDKSARVKTLGLYGWRLRYKVLKRLEQKALPHVQKGKKQVKVTYIHPDGRRFIVDKNRLLKELYGVVRRNSYYEISHQQFQKQYGFYSVKNLVEALDQQNYENFNEITA